MPVNPYESSSASGLAEIVRGTCFKGIALGGWKDEFSFFVASSPELPEQVKRFYLGQGACLVSDSPPLKLARGRQLWSVVGLVPERLLRQRIHVSFEEQNGVTKITVRYRVFVSVALRTMPYQLKPEVESLASQLQAVAEPSG